MTHVTTAVSRSPRARLRPLERLGLLGLAGAGLAALLLAGAPSAGAQPAGRKPKPAAKACGVSAIPLVVGNEWTYGAVTPPPDKQLTDAQTKLTPVRPDKIIIKVTGIETKDKVTTVTLREDIDGVGHDTTITCTAGGAKFQIGMDAFWFAGEPGQTYGIELANLDRKDSSLTLAGGKINNGVTDWRDDLTATWKHVPTAQAKPTMHGGVLELRRHWVFLPDEPVATGYGSWSKTKKLGLETTPRVGLDPPTEKPLKGDVRCRDNKDPICQCKDDKDPICVPPLLVNFFWMVDGVGPVQVLNSYGQMFQLNAATLQ